jgi:hypothetical protein
LLLKLRPLLLTLAALCALIPQPGTAAPVQNQRNLDCTHYPQPQTGVAYTLSAGEC